MSFLSPFSVNTHKQFWNPQHSCPVSTKNWNFTSQDSVFPMSSELFLFDNTFFTDPFSPSFIDDNIFQDNTMPTNCLIQEPPSIDQITSTLLSSSPPSHQFENLSLCQIGNPNYELADYSVKAEEFQVQFESDYSLMVPQNDVKLMQRSFSSNCFENNNNKTSFSIFTPKFDSLIESTNFQTSAAISSPENSFSSGQMRRVCSTGDLQVSPFFLNPIFLLSFCSISKRMIVLLFFSCPHDVRYLSTFWKGVFTQILELIYLNYTPIYICYTFLKYFLS